MPNMISMGRAGSVNPERVVMVASLDSAPVKRFIKELDPMQILNLTYGYPQKSIIVFENGMVAITRYKAGELAIAIRLGKEVHHDYDVPF
jgi:regulator of extracellular matrix RemA (YlzA/DUF370 family)